MREAERSATGAGADAEGDVHVVIDLSDLIIQASAGEGIGGIMRVVAQLMRYALRHSPDSVVPIFFHHGRQAYVRLDPAVFQDGMWTRATELQIAVGLFKVPLPFGGSRHYGKPLRRAYHVFRRRLKNRLAAMMQRCPAGARERGWAISDWSVPTTGKVRIAALGMSWIVPQQLERHLALAASNNVEIVTLVHDVIPIVAADGESEPNPAFRDWFGRTAAGTSRFLAVSQFTARDVAAVVPQLGGRIDWIRVVPLAHELDWSGEFDAGVVPEGEFVLSVASLGHRRKNLDQLLEAWGRLGARIGYQRLPALVLAGGHGKHAVKVTQAEERYPELKGKLVLVERPRDETLAALYQGCLFTVYPSRYEGWGLPVGESAWFGKLCVASNATSIPEVVGDAADYFDPGSIEAMIDALERPILDRAYLRRREEGLTRLKLRTWAEVADNLVAALKA